MVGKELSLITIDDMRREDVAEVLSIERVSFSTPWSEILFMYLVGQRSAVAGVPPPIIRWSNRAMMRVSQSGPVRIAAEPSRTAARCRSCGAMLRHTFLDLGMSPLCQTQIRPEDLNRGENFYPLHVWLLYYLRYALK